MLQDDRALFVAAVVVRIERTCRRPVYDIRAAPCRWIPERSRLGAVGRNNPGTDIGINPAAGNATVHKQIAVHVAAAGGELPCRPVGNRNIASLGKGRSTAGDHQAIDLDCSVHGCRARCGHGAIDSQITGDHQFCGSPCGGNVICDARAACHGDATATARGRIPEHNASGRAFKGYIAGESGNIPLEIYIGIAAAHLYEIECAGTCKIAGEIERARIVAVKSQTGACKLNIEIVCAAGAAKRGCSKPVEPDC